MTTDADFLLACLQDGDWHSLNEVLQKSLTERGCGLTVHSRAADLRKRGYVVEHRMVGRRGNGSVYRLVGSLTGQGADEVAPSETAPCPVSEPDGSLSEGDAAVHSGTVATPAATDARNSPHDASASLSLNEPEQLPLLPDPPRRGAYTEAA